MTQLYFLGIGSAFTTLFNQTSFIIVHEGANVLVDFGQTGPKSFLKDGDFQLKDVKYFLPTHSHADHVGGVEFLALFYRYVLKRKMPMIINEEYQRVLWDHTLRGGLEYNEEAAERNLCFADYFEVIRPTWKTNTPRETWIVTLPGNLKLEIFRTKHIPDNSPTWQASFLSYGMFINDHVLVTCDTRNDPELLEIYADRADVIFHDCQLFDGGVHASINELKKYPLKWTKKIKPMHYQDNFIKNEEELCPHVFDYFTRQHTLYSFEKGD